MPIDRIKMLAGAALAGAETIRDVKVIRLRAGHGCTAAAGSDRLAQIGSLNEITSQSRRKWGMLRATCNYNGEASEDGV